MARYGKTGPGAQFHVFTQIKTAPTTHPRLPVSRELYRLGINLFHVTTTPEALTRIEGAINAPLRQMLRDQRGMSPNRHVKAIFWWCYTHTNT